MKRLIVSAGLLLAGINGFVYASTEDKAYAEEADSVRWIALEDVTVTSTRATQKTPVAHVTIKKEEIVKHNTGFDLPFILQLTPSVVATSDAGGGIGHTGIRIRGTDASRINVTSNGVPMNDSESHLMYWINTPDIAASTQDIQIQRGVGTSTNGAGAFGATINLQTEGIAPEPYVELSGGYGSYNTHRASINVGTGLLGGKWGFNARLSTVSSDGYIDRGDASMKSYFFQGGYYGDKTTLKFITFGGKQQVYHAWNGITKEQMRLYGRRYNSSGGMEKVLRDEEGKPIYDESGKLQTTTDGYYNNQTDNYKLFNYQLLFTQRFTKKLSLNVSLHYYKGEGYYEEYKNAQKFERYGLTPFVPGNPELEPYMKDGKVVASNLVRRKMMDNWFAGGIFSLDYTSHKLMFSVGGAFNRYDGDHFGNVMWVQNYQDHANFNPADRYYDNVGKKDDFNIYAKAHWNAAKGLYLFGDVQYRHINYTMKGINDKWDSSLGALQPLDLDKRYNFFNPKVGLTYDINKNMSTYASFAVAHREPSRSNFRDAKIGVEPRSERLFDYEAGFAYKSTIFSAGVNLYYMKYKDQLILTGEVNHVGEPLTDNVPNSYRAGIELTAAIKPTSWLRWDLNATFSRNRIKQFTEYMDSYDSNWSGQEQESHLLRNTTIAYSPSIILGSMLSAEYRGWGVSLHSQFVSDQYLTNSASKLSADEKIGEYYDKAGNRLGEAMKLSSYFVNNLRFSYSFKLPYTRSVMVAFDINNLFGKKYCSNGGAGSYVVANPNAANGEYDRYNYAWFFPQATRNFMGSIVLKF